MTSRAIRSGPPLELIVMPVIFARTIRLADVVSFCSPTGMDAGSGGARKCFTSAKFAGVASASLRALGSASVDQLLQRNTRHSTLAGGIGSPGTDDVWGPPA